MGSGGTEPGGGPRRYVGDRFVLSTNSTARSPTTARRYHLELPLSTDLDPLASITMHPKDGVETIVRGR
ncbi:hypothetical protein ACFQPA_10785 [Halomarina halobia]|uniref:Uncharacterized protein n=1 Tax=Halomarina halobia TaxID=3033386 RepID=A0ABD6AAQ4_9EURY|nr:hypothetical protein [Halomarina sp. PSR21]